MPDRNPILVQREATHGSFSNTSRVWAEICQALSGGTRAADLTPAMECALSMIALKLSRIVSGDPRNRDSWRDVAGYADLVVEQIDAMAPRNAEPPGGSDWSGEYEL